MTSVGKMKLGDKFSHRFTREQVTVLAFTRINKNAIKIYFFGEVNKHRNLELNKFEEHFKPI